MKNSRYKPLSFEQSDKVCDRQLSLGSELSWAQYQNEKERLFYNNHLQHTLSMYLAGGYETHRTDMPSPQGGPGRFCLMPQDCESHWQLGSPQQFMHLYFDDDYIKQLAIQVFDRDPRLITIPELTFFENPTLEALFRHQMATMNWDPSSQLMMKQFSDSILISLLQSNQLMPEIAPIKGGLSPQVKRRVTDFMQAHFHRQIYLHELATLAQLSEYHFCRMFKQSFAATPQAYLCQLRIEQTQALIKQNQHNLTEIALDCGFANQSHMGRYFKQQLGISPSAFKRLHV
ncbi:helix-turn-helix domain-containing protein [Shewanella surugensis]|uniref:AraC family transcriptional regulator n=1 Tax=Shewanella surugensis TaxID=212020 RepID=A0ABT0LG22_9GAMM|nr:AraC family transcriptional regulator [Shewanella surugensis]MCL1126620.1 AraC family transcriptional regulator [Shewanella surugensis]